MKVLAAFALAAAKTGRRRVAELLYVVQVMKSIGEEILLCEIALEELELNL